MFEDLLKKEQKSPLLVEKLFPVRFIKVDHCAGIICFLCVWLGNHDKSP